MIIHRNSRIIKRNIEFWKSIDGFPDYEISNMGRVKSLERIVSRSNGCTLPLQERILKPPKGSDGYAMVCLLQRKNQKTKAIHSMVIRHFGEPKPSPKHECNHKDGDKENNWNTNLEWLTHKQNIQHAKEAGLLRPRKGELNGRALLTRKEVRRIRKLHKTGKYSCCKLAGIFCMSVSAIDAVVTHRSWKYIT